MVDWVVFIEVFRHRVYEMWRLVKDFRASLYVTGLGCRLGLTALGISLCTSQYTNEALQDPILLP